MFVVCITTSAGNKFHTAESRCHFHIFQQENLLHTEMVHYYYVQQTIGTYKCTTQHFCMTSYMKMLPVLLRVYDWIYKINKKEMK